MPSLRSVVSAQGAAGVGGGGMLVDERERVRRLLRWRALAAGRRIVSGGVAMPAAERSVTVSAGMSSLAVYREMAHTVAVRRSLDRCGSMRIV